MAEASRKNNVISTGTNGDTITGQFEVQAIKAIAGGSGMTVTIEDSGNNAVWKSILAANASEHNHLGCLRLPNGTYTVNISAGSGTIYVYVK